MSNLQINDKFANRYLLKKLIGVGGYSQVWLAEDTKSGNLDIALKIFAPGQGLDDKGLELFSKEYALVFNLNHPGLLKPTYFDDFEGSPYLVMQYCQQGSVFGKIGEMTEVELAHFMQQSASALNYLHQQDPPIIHQDIKPDNFLIDNQGNYLLADFGISSKIRRTLTKSIGAQASTGTLAYMPPEKFSADKQIIKAGDIFSLGVTMYELLTGDLPFGDNGGLTLKAGADVPNLPTNFSPDLNRLLISCMAKDPWKRPPAEKLEEAASKFLQTGKWTIVGVATPNLIPAPPNEPVPPIGGRKTQPIPEPVPGSLPAPPPNPPVKPKFKYWPIIATVLLILVIGIAVAWWYTTPIVKKTDESIYSVSIKVIDTLPVGESQATSFQDSVHKIVDKMNVPEETIQQQSDQSAYNDAKTANSKAAYEKYLRDYPTGQYVAEAKIEINNINQNQNTAKTASEKVVQSGNGSFYFEMVFVQGGTFQMGSNDGRSDEKPIHSVTLSDFYIGKTEVTQKQWRDIMGNDPSYFKNCDNCPVEQVSWDDIQGFLQKLNQKTGKIYRLPTEAEWEYAARGGNKSKRYTYSGSNNPSDVAWFTVNSRSKTHPAAQLQPNELGIYDMSGNVYEWCSDWYGNYSSSALNNPQGSSTGAYRIIRGGSYNFTAYDCRSTNRYDLNPDDRYVTLGFRLVIP